jgi:hypothetical protein
MTASTMSPKTDGAMTRIVTSPYCPKHAATKQLRLALAQIIVTSDLSFLLCLAVIILLAGCTENARPSEEYLTGNGYWYHDGNHQAEGAHKQARIGDRC